jgi:hypothetical protein
MRNLPLPYIKPELMKSTGRAASSHASAVIRATQSGDVRAQSLYWKLSETWRKSRRHGPLPIEEPEALPAGVFIQGNRLDDTTIN